MFIDSNQCFRSICLQYHPYHFLIDMEYERADKYFLAIWDFWFQTDRHNGIFCLAHQSRSLIDEAAKLDLLGRPQRCAGSMHQNRIQIQW